MRRMIGKSQAEGLKKLNENIVINDTGTQVEIGGNVIVENLGNIGVMEGSLFVALFHFDSNNHLLVWNGTQYVEFAPVESAQAES